MPRYLEQMRFSQKDLADLEHGDLEDMRYETTVDGLLEEYGRLNTLWVPEADGTFRDERVTRDRKHFREAFATPLYHLEGSWKAKRAALERSSLTIFAKIAQLRGNLLWRELGSRGATSEELATSGEKTPLGILQAVLTHPTDRLIIPSEKLETRAQVQGALGSIIIDIRYLVENDQLLANLGVPVKFWPSKQNAQLLSAAQHVPAIKERLMALVPEEESVQGEGFLQAFDAALSEAGYYTRTHPQKPDQRILCMRPTKKKK